MLLPLIVGTLSGAAELAGAGPGDLSLEQQIDQLEQKVDELNHIVALLMENLANCTEENEALSRGANGVDRHENVITGEKVGLIERIQSALETETYLGFLNALNERQLNTLLGLIEEKANMPMSGEKNAGNRLPAGGADTQ